MISSHHVTKRNFRPDELTIGGRSKRSTTSSFVFGNTCLPIGHVVANRPLALVVGKPSVFLLSIEAGEITMPFQVDVLEPKGR